MTVQSPSGSSDQVKVAVRARPFNKREIDLATKCVIQMEKSQTILQYPKEAKQPKIFAFDNCFDSIDPETPSFADQDKVFESIGVDVVDNAFQGYNACILAYGQTGSGKSYTMMGNSENPGLIPRLCNRIFERINQESNEQTTFKVEVSYMEIYNEKVHDLLDPKNSSKRALKVREHLLLGPMVDGLSVLAVSSFEQITQLMDEGNKCRTVASTNMNSESSRSHAVFTIHLTQIVSDIEKSFTGEKCSKISLVDLAGSERAQKSGAVGKRLEEGGNINKSLCTLGLVISALADKSNGKKEKFIPYRDSVLTWLLKDNLGGNSKTIMIATISPAADNFEETLSTLRYADRAKRIVNHAVVNEDPNAKVIRELKEEVEMLRNQINQNQERQNEAEELRQRLFESENLINQMNKTWTERLQETEILTRERQQDFADIGVSGMGIKVEKDRFYLVNLNADPSLNELLIYYINQHAVIGSQEANGSEDKVDFLLQGLGVQPKHAILEVFNDDEKPKLFISLLTDNARVCVNGTNIEFGQKLLLKNGDRLLIGNNHFFRVNCPRDEDELTNQMNTSICSAHFDYDRAWLEANSNTSGSTQNPIKAVDQYIEQIAIKHEEEKQAALEKQYEEFERYLQGLTHNLQTPSTPMTPAVQFSGLPTPSLQLPPVTFNSLNPRTQKSRFLKWAQHREELLKESLCQLKTEIVRANALVREANLIAEELWSKRRGLSHYEVTLQIPVQNLRPSKIRAGNTVCEPVIVVKRHGMSGHQTWSMEQLENKLIDMREIYNERRIGSLDMIESNTCVDGSCSSSSGILSGDEAGEMENEKMNPLIDTLFESQEKHTLIGVANIFLEVLFHDLRLDYQVPIISQQGEACGKLHIEIYRLPDDPSLNGEFSENCDQSSNAFLGRTIRCRVRIKKASNLPPQLSHFVFCQYGFFNANDMLVVAPCFDEEHKRKAVPRNSFKFDHQKDHIIQVTEEFLEYVQEDALSVEIWGHRSCGSLSADDEDEALDDHLLNTSSNETELVTVQKQKRLQELWNGVTRRIELWVEIKELNENGDYESVEVTQQADVSTGGIYQLKQGLQRRLYVRLRQSTEKGGLPLAFSDLSTVAIGSLTVREANTSIDEQPLDSYQETGLEQIRDQWCKALDERQKYLNMQISESSSDPEREAALIRQLMLLTEERKAVLLPEPNSNIPGAQVDWSPPNGIEYNIPVMFLDVNADELTDVPDCDLMDSKVVGLSSVLPKERYDQMVLLPIVEKDTIEMSATTCCWDSSLHNEPLLNKASTNGELIYAIVRVVVRLSYPFNTELVLRKRICINVYKKTSFKDRLLRRIVDNKSTTGTGVYYDVVASVPKSSLDMEDRSSLALMAARHINSDQPKSELENDRSNYIEAYIKSIQAVEWMLKLDRLRQESAVLNMLSRHEKAQRISYGLNGQNRMKRTISLPNAISNITLPPVAPKQNEGQKVGENGASMAVQNKLMDVSTSSTSSGYSSMVNSFVMNNLSSPVADASNKLSGIDEELQSDDLTAPIRSSTVPEAMCFNGQIDSMNGNTPLESNGYYSCTNQLFQATTPPSANNNYD